MGRDQLDVALCEETSVELVRVVRSVADELGRKLVEKARIERVFYELRLMSLTTCNPNGDRKASAV
jgi:hypothetical protein